MGRGQAVRRRPLEPVFEGSNPSAPTKFLSFITKMRPTGFGELKVFSGSAHPQLAAEIAEFLGVELGQARLRRFPDTEVSFQIANAGTAYYVHDGSTAGDEFSTAPGSNDNDGKTAATPRASLAARTVPSAARSTAAATETRAKAKEARSRTFR